MLGGGSAEEVDKSTGAPTKSHFHTLWESTKINNKIPDWPWRVNANTHHMISLAQE